MWSQQKWVLPCGWGQRRNWRKEAMASKDRQDLQGLSVRKSWMEQKEGLGDWSPCLWRMGVKDYRGFFEVYFCKTSCLPLPLHCQVMSISSRLLRTGTTRPSIFYMGYNVPSASVSTGFTGTFFPVSASLQKGRLPSMLSAGLLTQEGRSTVSLVLWFVLLCVSEVAQYVSSISLSFSGKQSFFFFCEHQHS